MIFCFDTSVINQLNRVRNGEQLVTSLLATNDVYISSLNVIEIGKTPDPQLREQLRALAKRLAKDYHPLELTNHLVQQLCRAYEQGLKSVSWSISDEREQLWVALSEPNALGEEERHELEEWAQTLERDQQVSNREFRKEVDRIFASNTASRPDTPGKLARLYMSNRMLLYEVTAGIYKRVTDRVLPLSHLETFLEARLEFGRCTSLRRHTAFSTVRFGVRGFDGRSGTVDRILLDCSTFGPQSTSARVTAS